jgi:hypothetical protein
VPAATTYGQIGCLGYTQGTFGTPGTYGTRGTLDTFGTVLPRIEV